MKPKYHTSKFRNQTIGTSLVTVISLCFGSPAFAVDNFWVGGTSNDWNTASNWSLGRVPVNPNGAPTGDTFDDAVVNTKSPIATISANVPTPRDFRVGQGAATDGQVNHTAGNASTGGGNWAFIGREGGTGVYNLANTAGTGGALTGFALGSGSFTCNGSRLYVGGANADGGAGIGTFNMNTSGSLTIGTDLTLGAAGGTGLMNVDAGSITTGGWNFFGKDENGTGATGILKMSGGTLTNTGSRTYVGFGNATGSVEMSGGTYTNTNGDNNTFFAIGVRNLDNASTPSLIMTGGTLNAARRLSVGGMENNNGNTDANFAAPGKGSMTVDGASAVVNATGELWVGQGTGGSGTLEINAGTINSGSWIAVGRQSGTGTVNMNGGTWNKTGGGSAFIIGATGPGTLTQTDGLINVSGGDTWMGEAGVATFNLLGGEFRAGYFQLARNGGSTGNVFLQGGILRVNQIAGGGGTENLHFDGTQIIATAIQDNFVNGIGLGQAIIDGGGMKIDSNGFDIGSTHAFTGTGGVIKSGVGTLSLSGASNYSGPNTVSAGKLAVTTANTGSGDYAVAADATLSIRQTSGTASLTVPNATFGSVGNSNLDINLGNLAGNPTAAPLNVTGTLTANGTVTVNISDTLPAIGNIPLISYVGPTSVAANFVLGTLPNGVVATLDKTTTPGLVFLNVTSASLPLWKGYVDGVWNTTTANWLEQVTNTPNSLYADPAPVLFNDTATGTTLISLPGTVSPSKVTFNNSTLGYFLSGAGKISGNGSLLKQGTASLSISTLNDYLGTTTLEGGSTSVTSLANGGTASSIGASGAGAANLVLSGGTLNYTGANTTTNRGFTIGAVGSTISTVNSLTMSGPVVTTVGGFTKAGIGNLTLSNPGAITLASAGQVARVNGGTLTLDGSGTQTITVLGELWVGNTPNSNADLVLNNTSLTVSSWISIGIGNGTTGALTKFMATGSTIQCTNFSTGFDGTIALNDSDQTILLTNSTWTNSGRTTLAESLNSTTNMTLAGASSFSSTDQTELGLGTGTVANLTVGGTSTYVANRLTMAHGTGSSTNLTIQDSGSVSKIGGWLSIGNSNNGVGVMTVKDSGSFIGDGDFNVADVGTSTGTLNIQDNAVVTSTGGAVFVAKNGNTTGTVNLDGGRLIANRVFGNGGAGNSTFNFNGGVLQVGANPNQDFISGIDSVFVKAGGGTLDTAGSNISISSEFLDGGGGGGITKAGAGTLSMNGLNGYTGTTQVTGGTLGGTGFITGPVVVGALGNLNPGVTTGTLTVDSLTFVAGGKLTIDLAAAADTVAVANALAISNATLVYNGTPTSPVHVLATYGEGQLTGTFSTPPPAGYTYDYNYLGLNQIAITRPATDFETWAAANITAIEAGADATSGGNPDGDGLNNFAEFGLNDNPLSGASSGKVVSKIANVGGVPSLVLSLPVRTVATFGNVGGKQVSTLVDGLVYTVEGSAALATWNVPVSQVGGGDKTAIESTLPAMGSTDWSYHTFTTGPVSAATKDFMRIIIQQP